MRKNDAFSSYHPFVELTFFVIAAVITMFATHPAVILVSFISALIYSFHLNRRGALSFVLKFLLPMMAAAAVIQPLFSHRGMTILCYLPSGNPLTLESILYGISASFLLGAALLWFRCFSAVMTSDKFVYLFGRVIPSFSLLLSITLGAVPKFRSQLETVRDAQSCIGRYDKNAGLITRVKNGVNILSIMITWSLESAVETAGSMKGKGYGVGKRTSFSIYRFEKKDRSAMFYFFACGAAMVAAESRKCFEWRYFPSISGVVAEPLSVIVLIIFAIFCLTPVIIDRREEKKWHSLRSKI